MIAKVIAVVLGGGRGTRLEPLTAARSKPAVPIAGKYRLVDIPISNCLNSGYDRIFVLTQFNSASLNAHIKNTYNFGVFSKGFVDILAAEQTPRGDRWYQGTADAVRQCLRYMEPYEHEYVLILSGDQLYQMDFREMITYHESKGAEITVATIPVGKRDAPSFGILKADENGVITSFVEKPPADLLPGWTSEVSPEMQAQGREHLASMGIYIFNRGVLTQLLSETEQHDFGKEVIPHSIITHKVFSYQYDGYWTDIGSIPSFFEANIGLTAHIPEFNLFSNDTIYTRSRMLPPSKIAGTTLDQAIIAGGCIINAGRIEHSVIGIRSRIGKDTVIKNTYMMGNDYYQSLDELRLLEEADSPVMGVGERCYIDQAILDKNCFIGDEVRIEGGPHLKDGDYGKFAVREGIVVLKKRAVLPPGTEIC